MADAPLRDALREASRALVRRIEELSFVRLVGDLLAGEVEPAAIARTLGAALRDELGVDVAALWTIDAAAGGLRAAGDPSAPLVPFAATRLGDAAAGAVVRDVGGASGGLPAELAGMNAALLHPVAARGRVLAVIALGAVEADGLGDDHARLVALVAPAVAMALENAELYARLAAENRTLRAELGAREATASWVGTSAALRRLRDTVARLAPVDVTVLVLGPSGSGKEMVARALHAGGPRRAGPFVALNCAALPETLLESELFGIERGVATGVERRAGLVERAGGGTLFLDEIGDMSLAVQAKMLRVLEEREVMRVGGARPIPVDVRIVAATHRDLPRAVGEGAFREDLFFRLKVASVTVPALAARREDIPLLAHHFLARAAARHGRPALRLGPDAVAALSARAWPGNVRELANAIEQAVVMAEGPVIGAAEVVGIGVPAPASDLDYRGTVAMAVAEAERVVLERALVAAGQNRTRAARLLGIGRRTLLYKLRRHAIGRSG